VIVATAGHVDHGKTALIKQLTGIDTDRLPEEKARGLTIDLGFAYTPLTNGDVLGFVDVPGHGRFIRNMLAGVGAIDYALLVVAADDGCMPQTAEHLAILDLLKIPAGVIVITKTDRMAPERVAQVKAQIAARVRGTFLEDADIFPVSNPTGEGIEALRTYLFDIASAAGRRRKGGHFRLAVDRRFSLRGVGLVVTGAVFSGSVAVGDQLVISPTGIEVRVRAIHAQNREAQVGFAGERLALNLTGADLKKEGIARGDWVVAPAAHAPVTRIDGRVHVLPSEDRPLRQESTVHVHLGAADVQARVAILEGRSIIPGESGLVQLMLDHPTVAVHADRFVLRDQSSQRTIGGGSVIDPFGPARGRARPMRINLLKALERETMKEAFEAILAEVDTGVDLNWFERAMNLTAEEAQALWAEAAVVKTGAASQSFALTQPRWKALCQELSELVERWPPTHPDSPGISLAQVRKSTARWHPPVLLAKALESLVESGCLRSAGQLYYHATYRARAAPKDELGERILAVLAASGTPPATVNEIAARVGTTATVVERNLTWAAKRGIVRQVSQHRFFLPRTIAELALHAEKLSSEMQGGLFRVTDFRDRTGVGRNPSIELLEYFDKLGFTRRTGNDRRVVRSAKMFARHEVL
jgi:selenocysteine-specific elongation factor